MEKEKVPNKIPRENQLELDLGEPINLSTKAPEILPINDFDTTDIEELRVTIQNFDSAIRTSQQQGDRAYADELTERRDLAQDALDRKLTAETQKKLV